MATFVSYDDEEAYFKARFNRLFKRMAKDLKAYVGPRCPDYEPECAVCQAWRAYDEMVKVMAFGDTPGE